MCSPNPAYEVQFNDGLNANGVTNGGFGADMVIPNAALVSLTARANRNNEGATGLLSGHPVSSGIESTGEVFSASLETIAISFGTERHFCWMSRAATATDAKISRL